MRARSAKAQLSDISSSVYSAIFAMTPRQRGAAVRALDGLTTTNCNWTLYEMRSVLRRFIDSASSFTELKARARARTKRVDSRRRK